MAKKNDFLKFRKTAAVKKDMVNIAINSGVRGAAAVGASAGVNLVGGMVPAAYQKFLGPVMFLAGVAVEAYAENKTVQAAAQGVQAFAALKTAKDLAPAVIASKMGLGSVSENQPEVLEIDSQIDSDDDYLESLLNETDKEIYQETETETDLNGVEEFEVNQMI